MRIAFMFAAILAGCQGVSAPATAETDSGDLRSCEGETVTVQGKSLYNGDVAFDALLVDGEYRLIDCKRMIFTYDMHRSTDFDKARHFTSKDGKFTDSKQREAVSVHWAAQELYDFYDERFGRKGYDDQDTPLLQYVHYGRNYFNAVFDKGTVIYGDGGLYNSTAIVSLDYTGHEVTHGVTLTTASLIYQDESGALNESFSDIIAKTFEHHVLGESATWDMFPDIYKDDGMSTRSMSDPQTAQVPWDNTAKRVLRRRGAQGEKTVLRALAQYYMGPGWQTGPEDNGGVYANSGPNSHWFYLLSEGGSGTNHLGHAYRVNGIGIDKAADIAWRSLTVYLRPNSDYLDARYSSEQAAIDLYGNGSTELAAVKTAWNAVAVTEENYRSVRRIDRNVKYIALVEGSSAYDAALGAGFPHPAALSAPTAYTGQNFWYLHSSSAVTTYPEFLSYHNWTIAAGRGYEIRFTERGGKAMFIDASGDRGVKPVPFEVWALGAKLNEAGDDVRMVPIVFDIDKNNAFGLFRENKSPWDYSMDHPALGGTMDRWTDMIHISAPKSVAPGSAGYDAFARSGRSEVGDTHLSWLALVRPDGQQTKRPVSGQTFRLVLSRKDGATMKARPAPVSGEQ